MRRKKVRTLSRTEIRAFRRAVRVGARKAARTLPWRATSDPYKIMVSEYMLQQTQVERVIPKYHEFLKRFPTAQSLSAATLGSVLGMWSGLGYNRRACMLHACARAIARRHGGRIPDTQAALVMLPGIGPYTAGAISVFAFNEPAVLIETNIRSVFIHHFFPRAHAVHDALLRPFIEQTIDRKDPRAWYNMLMDYGAWIKDVHGNPNRRSLHYTKQLPFKGSIRQMRGAIIRLLIRGPRAEKDICAALGSPKKNIISALTSLAQEGMIVRSGVRWRLPKTYRVSTRNVQKRMPSRSKHPNAAKIY